MNPQSVRSGRWEYLKTTYYAGTRTNAGLNSMLVRMGLFWNFNIQGLALRCERIIVFHKITPTMLCQVTSLYLSQVQLVLLVRPSQLCLLFTKYYVSGCQRTLYINI